MYQIDKEQEKTTQQVLDVLEKWGSESKFIWFRELHRVTDIDKGILRNIINELKKSKEIKDLHGTNNRIFFCLKKYYVKCRDVEFRFKGKVIMLRDGSKTKIIQGETKSTERTRKRLAKQRNKRRAKSFTKAKSRRPHKS
jgi:predicted transcriptional regulator|tara:strand:- start:116 stop:535 length:420 start_codon:yes stop_codon:yes gene_type:complete